MQAVSRLCEMPMIQIFSFFCMSQAPNKSLQATRDGRSSSASRYTLVGPACLSCYEISQEISR